MINKPINEAETVLEAYFDGGESYPEHEKYSLLPKYKVTPEGALKQWWASFFVTINPNEVVFIERECDIDISDYDIMRLFVNSSKKVNIKLICNGIEIFSENGSDGFSLLKGEIKDRALKSIRYELTNMGEITECVDLFYLGTENKAMKERRDNRKTPYNDEWEGCFLETPEIGLHSDILLASQVSEKLNYEPFKTDYKLMKELADKLMKTTPEELIGPTINKIMRAPIHFHDEMCVLSFVGYVEKDAAMLRMACRYMLSLAHSGTWNCDPSMEGLAGATWHGRSFNVMNSCVALGIAMEFSGSLLSWHGKNIIYDAIIMKGLPRMEADFMTMEYIRHMNQGIAFSYGYIFALLTLIKKYPRYKVRLTEAENTLNEMLETCINKDGGVFEGAGYWQYTVLSYLLSAVLIANYKKISLKDYVGDRLNKTAEFGLAMLTDNGKMIPVGDASAAEYLPFISSTFSKLTNDDRWKNIFNIYAEAKRDKQELLGCNLHTIYFTAADVTDKPICNNNDHFSVFPDTGYTSINREGIRFFGVSGSSFSHCHSDKGHFMIYKEGEPLIIDRGICDYSLPNGKIMSASDMHNLLIPENDKGISYNQYTGSDYGAKLIRSEYNNNEFIWETDNIGVWDSSVVKKCVRRVVSNEPNIFIITDEMEFTEPTTCSFRLNMYDNSGLTVEPIGWKPEKTEYKIFGTDAKLKPVYQLRLYAEKSKLVSITTKICCL